MDSILEVLTPFLHSEPPTILHAAGKIKDSFIYKTDGSQRSLPICCGIHSNKNRGIGNWLWILEIDTKGKSKVKAKFEILSLVSPVYQGQ
jgi:hypothetical protein